MPSPAPFWPSTSGLGTPAVRGRILVVEDDEDVRNTVVEILRRAGYQVEGASDGEAGWSALGAEPFDLLITDHDMPRLTGLDLLRRLQTAGRELPCILMSGNLPWEATDLFGLLPSKGVLEKPFQLRDLLAKVHALLPAELIPWPAPPPDPA